MSTLGKHSTISRVPQDKDTIVQLRTAQETIAKLLKQVQSYTSDSKYGDIQREGPLWACSTNLHKVEEQQQIIHNERARMQAEIESIEQTHQEDIDSIQERMEEEKIQALEVYLGCCLH